MGHPGHWAPLGAWVRINFQIERWGSAGVLKALKIGQWSLGSWFRSATGANTPVVGLVRGS